MIMDDVRYSELLFLRELAKSSMDHYFTDPDGTRARAVGLKPAMYIEMAATLIEDLYAKFDSQAAQLVVARLRGELSPDLPPPVGIYSHHWSNPREGLHNLLTSQSLQRILITYRGLRRIEELRDQLRRDRILEYFGVLLDKRYFLPDLEDALRRGPDVPVTVIYADMDNFKAINTEFGHAGGDVMMKAYLEAVCDSVGQLGTAYRMGGDETASIVIGQGHERAIEIAERIRNAVAALRCEYKDKPLPKVTASMGVASTPPEPRTTDIETLADARNDKAKRSGKNRVVAE